MALPPFTTLVEEHRGAVWGYLCAMAGPASAPDLLQDTLLSALRAYPSLKDGSNLRSWLLSVAHSRVVDGARARARRPEVLGDVPERATTHAETDDELWQAVAALPDKQRHAVVLRFVGDLPYAEIGALCETSEAAARQNVRAGVMRLREELS
ncbi:MAG TPA: sigma-70 family RNA polymerase sigma factor [Acidimicrobiales bacterium]|nr:sigma-70 family RNA polymerase sigma factor [Acidimicrobiales bacterium]